MTRSAFSQQDMSDLLSGSVFHLACLQAVDRQQLPDAWIGAGFLRNLVWDHLHGFDQPTPLADVDVIYFDPGDPEGLQERQIERDLTQCLADSGLAVAWEVRNQARMHRRNDDPAYKDSAHALEHWLETPTAVAVRLSSSSPGGLEYLAPFGFEDLFNLVIRPTPHARSRADRLAAYQRRLASKPWITNWPELRLEP
ncbi:nucleotidyltransferase family protein [Rhodovibrionaceae bacterium A322]